MQTPILASLFRMQHATNYQQSRHKPPDTLPVEEETARPWTYRLRRGKKQFLYSRLHSFNKGGHQQNGTAKYDSKWNTGWNGSRNHYKQYRQNK
jgi:hypothetical protein